MSYIPWDFPTWQLRDAGPDKSGARNTTGTGYQQTPVSIPSNVITCVFPFLFRSETAAPHKSWTGNDNTVMGFTSIGRAADAGSQIHIYMYYDKITPANSRVFVNSWNTSLGAWRYLFQLGDEDGVNWLQEDKWYQCVIVYGTNSLTFAINGSITPSTAIGANTPSGLDFNSFTRRWWHHSPEASWGAANTLNINSQWGSYVAGPTAFKYTALDLTDSAVMNRIYDTNNNFKPCGADGSLWFGDTYGVTRPEVFFPNGAPNPDLGSAGLTWTTNKKGTTVPSGLGGLRSQFE